MWLEIVFSAVFQESLDIPKSHQETAVADHVTAVVDHRKLHLIGVKRCFPTVGKRFEEGTKFNKTNLLFHKP